VKDSGRGSKNPPRKNKAKNELKNNNKKQMEEQPKLDFLYISDYLHFEFYHDLFLLLFEIFLYRNPLYF
jgi:hypothetical protein